MTSMIPFAFEDHLVRVVKPNGAPWFVGKDVCDVLDISKHHQALERLDADERGTYSVGTPSGEQNMICVSEAGCYRLIFTSRKPEAERFKRWLAHDVLPQLRRHGFYALPGETPPQAYELPVESVPLQAYGLKLETVRLASRVHGLVAARAMWNVLGLPPVPGYEPVRDDEAKRCLAHLLGSVTNIDSQDRPARTLGEWLALGLDDGEGDTRLALKRGGIAVVEEPDGFVVANSHLSLNQRFQGTEWAKGHWWPALRRLPGATPYKRLIYGAKQARGTFIPADLLADNLDAQPRGTCVPLSPA